MELLLVCDCKVESDVYVDGN